MGMVEQCSHKMRILDWIQLKYPMHSGIRGNEAKNATQHSEMAEMLPFRPNLKGAFDCQNAHQNLQEVTPLSQTTSTSRGHREPQPRAWETVEDVP